MPWWLSLNRSVRDTVINVSRARATLPDKNENKSGSQRMMPVINRELSMLAFNERVLAASTAF